MLNFIDFNQISVSQGIFERPLGVTTCFRMVHLYLPLFPVTFVKVTVDLNRDML